MKKVIAVAAGLMLTGALVTTASAAVSFSGDARIRGYYETDYDLGRTVAIPDTALRTRTNEKDVKANSRYRVQINADAKGGAYVRSRIKIGDGTHGTGGKTSVDTDYMYVGVPMGPVTIEGGRMPAHITKFFVNDKRYDMIIAKWANDMTDLQFWSRTILEDSVNLNDDDTTGYYVRLGQKFAGDFGLVLGGAYIDDSTPADLSGFTGTAHIGGPAGPVSLEAEFAYQNEDLTADSDDAGYGGYIQGGMDFGATSLTLNGGWAQDGFEADSDFGFIMLGGGSSITPAPFATFGGLADTTWIGGIVGFKASEALSLKGTLAYAKYDDVGDAFEIAGSLKYIISDGANIQWDIGYVSWSADSTPTVNPLGEEESPFGTAVTLNVSF